MAAERRKRRIRVRRTLTAAVALLTVAAIFVAVAAGGTGSARQPSGSPSRIGPGSPGWDQLDPAMQNAILNRPGYARGRGTRHRVGIDIKGADPFGYQLVHGRDATDAGSATFCCWDSWDITRAGAKVEVTNPRITLTSEGGRGQSQLTIRERIEWTPLSDGWSV